MNWNRAQIKDLAKSELKISYWLSFGVCLLASILGAGGSGMSMVYNVPNNTSNYYNSFAMAAPRGRVPATTAWLMLLSTMLVIILIVFLIAFAYNIFVGSVTLVGQKRFFTQAPKGNREFNNLFYGFTNGSYMKTVKTMLVMNIYIFLWTLLLIVPGIIKSYEYKMVPYLLADNPNMSTKEALELSSRMTNGNKMDMFILDLSFLGWLMLAGLAASVVGMFAPLLAFLLGTVAACFVMPYIEATYAQLYFILSNPSQSDDPDGFREVV